MIKKALLFLLLAVTAAAAYSQVPVAIGVQILKAEDARRYDSVLEGLMKAPDAAVRKRAALAAGRIGDDRAIPALAALLNGDSSDDVKAMAAFALGEIESVAAGEIVLNSLNGNGQEEAEQATPPAYRARLIEAAGKIAGAHPNHPRSRLLAKAIVDELRGQASAGAAQDRETVLLALTAALRTPPQEATERAVAAFLTNSDARIRSDAANTLARLKGKSANEKLRQMLARDTDAVARANAARALGAAADKEALEPLLNAAAKDADLRVRVSAIRSIGSLNDPKAVPHLLASGRLLLDKQDASKAKHPAETNELLEIATTLGRLMPNTEDDNTVTFLNRLRMNTGFAYPETEIALATVAPKAYVAARLPDDFGYRDPWVATAYAQGLAKVADNTDEELRMAAAEKLRAWVGGMAEGVKPRDQARMLTAAPEMTRAMAAFKPDNLDEVLRRQLTNENVFIRATAAELLAERPLLKENTDALAAAFSKAMLTDRQYNDAQLGILAALYKLDKRAAVGTLLIALNAPDHLVRRQAFQMLANPDLQKEFPGLPTSLEAARAKHKDQVLPYSPANPTKMGQVLNTDADYRRALLRRNGTVKAVITTEKGAFTIDLLPEDAPLTVDNFVKLARARYFNGVEVHRVVPNFVMQDGDPRGDGNGGPGWSIRCEINMVPYDRGAVGMALSGKDTGGSQWFVTHSPQPHLEGGYTVFGRVNESDMKVVDNIVRGDRITSVRIVEGSSPAKHAKGRKK